MSHQILQDKAQKGMDGILRQEEPCGGSLQQRPGGLTASPLTGSLAPKSGSQEPLNPALEGGPKRSTLCKQCGDEHEDAYISYVDRSQSN